MEAGAWVAATSALVATIVALLLREKLASVLVLVALGSAGAGIGWGGMLIQPDPSPGEFVAAVAMLTVLVPAHVRIVLGPFGPRG